MNGYEACRQLRKMIQDKEIEPVRIVASTADVTSSNMQKCKDAGFEEVLSKPIVNAELKRVLTMYM
jgi:CheY-like chemotaxis protein